MPGLKPNQIEAERLRMMDGDTWPNWPILPVKNYTNVKPGEFPECGCLLWGGWDEHPTNKAVVLKTTMWQLKPGLLKPDEYESVEYEDLYALLDAGWMGD